MELKREGNILNIYGNIKSIEDFEKIKNELEEIKKTSDKIIINIVDSMSITSSVIGYLIKLVEEGVDITVKVKKDLFDFLDELNLISKLNVRIL